MFIKHGQEVEFTSNFPRMRLTIKPIEGALTPTIQHSISLREVNAAISVIILKYMNKHD